MNDRNALRWTSLLATLTLCVAGSVRAQEAAGQMTGQNMAEMKFVPFPGMPTCTTGAVQSGDPSKGPSVILAKATAGCTFPWHWHTPSEHLMMVTGVATVEMKDGKPLKLQAGGFAMMPSHHVHRFTCAAACALFVYSDAPFDMHYVDAQGKEIPPEAALKAVGETAAVAGK